MSRSRLGLLALVAGAPLLLAILGTTHPARLNDDTADHWLVLHTLALPVFPLLGASPWVLVRRYSRTLGMVTAFLGYIYATFYTALDVLAGIGAGVLQVHQGGAGKFDLYQRGNELALVGVYAFLLATVIASAVVLVHARLKGLLGALVAVAGAVLFLDSHIYWPRGVLAMTALAVGFAGLAWAADSTQRQPARPPAVS